ncbi:uncharacterized protein LOC119102623 [Pollicipes pollicipes]|uniref:uncharacterized protein LOC119102623 n=1 Tax=Pollicipes pollicipes TaxID=41117 RepID=UPI00188587C9|nr:uncharacterized protein LOC119102623 [Pollicipes pollicipes]
MALDVEEGVRHLGCVGGVPPAVNWTRTACLCWLPALPETLVTGLDSDQVELLAELGSGLCCVCYRLQRYYHGPSAGVSQPRDGARRVQVLGAGRPRLAAAAATFPRLESSRCGVRQHLGVKDTRVAFGVIGRPCGWP